MLDGHYQKIIEKLLSVGLPGLLLVIIILFVQDPDRVVKIQEIISRFFFRIFKWFGNAYVKSTITSSLNNFLNKNVNLFL
jgi:hypothetical protein